MKRHLNFLLGILVVLTFQAIAQEHYTEGPVWRVTLVRVKPGQDDAYLTSLRQNTKPLLDEQKKQGLIVDYKVFLKETSSSPQDWDIAVAVQYKNHAAMDNLTAKEEAIRDKVSSKQKAQQVAQQRVEIREIVASELLQEVILK